MATDANVGAKLESVYVAMNMHWEDLDFEPPAPPTGMEWHVVANTAVPSPEDISEPGSEPQLGERARLSVGGRSVVVLIAK